MTPTIVYSVYIENTRWQEWVKNGEIAGTTGQSLRLEAIRIKLKDLSSNNVNIIYRVHIQGIGWDEWVKNGEIAGTIELGLTFGSNTNTIRR